jgi:predicted enzyme related to lactoylglutathione lyase
MPMLALNAVVYAKDARRLAGFYGQLLSLSAVESGDGFVRLAAAGYELTVVQAPPQIADTLVIADPPAVREETPVKLSFAVAGIEALRPLIEGLGGGLREAGWSWRGARHVDGWDPEGNVFQLRQQDA